jgi:hypothetical protein
VVRLVHDHFVDPWPVKLCTPLLMEAADRGHDDVIHGRICHPGALFDPYFSGRISRLKNFRRLFDQFLAVRHNHHLTR